ARGWTLVPGDPVSALPPRSARSHRSDRAGGVHRRLAAHRALTVGHGAGGGGRGLRRCEGVAARAARPVLL
ncbi:MAG: hypothetical protein AVDCRST_MAG52-1561, partial [uncultured Blastococcus sp.]